MGSTDTVAVMTCRVIFENMIVKDECDGVARTHDFEMPGVNVRLPE